jgi:hypothetical protein
MAKKRLIFAGVLLLLAFAGIVWSSSLYGRQSRQKGLGNAVEVIDSTPGEGAMMITLRNRSTKNINALQIAVGGSVFLVEFLDADEPKQKLAPGAVYKEWFSIRDSSKVEVAVLAAVFDDRTGAGDQRLVDEVLEVRRGVKKQLERFSTALQQMLNSPDADSLVAIEKLTERLDQQLEDTPADSGGMRLGQRKAKQQIRNELEVLKRTTLKDPTRTIRMGLTSIEQRNGRRIANLQ